MVLGCCVVGGGAEGLIGGLSRSYWMSGHIDSSGIAAVGRMPQRERSGGSGDGQERFALFGPKRLHEPVRRRELQRG